MDENLVTLLAETTELLSKILKVGNDKNQSPTVRKTVRTLLAGYHMDIEQFLDNTYPECLDW